MSESPPPTPRRRVTSRIWIPLSILIIGCGLSVWLWRGLVQRQYAGIRRATAQEAAIVRTAISTRMQVRAQALVRLAQRMEYWGGPHEILWQMNVTMLQEHLPGYQSIEWVDPSMKVHLTAASAPAGTQLTDDLQKMPEQAAAFEEARHTRKAAISAVRLSDPGQSIFSIHVPVFKDNQFLGEVVGVFYAEDIFDAIINQLEGEEVALRGYSFSIHSGETRLYTHFRGHETLEQAWSRSVPFNIQSTSWTLKVWPSDELFSVLRTSQPETALAGGIIMSLLLAMAVHLAMLSRWHARRSEQTNQLLRREITRRHGVEAALRETADQLTRSNHELQDFASVASHDLQEPLRKIQSFGDRLNVLCADHLGEKGQDYLQRMNQAARRMRTLIEDLLTFSRVTTQAHPFRSVDLSQVASEVIDDLETRIEQAGANVEVGPLPRIDADPLQMRQLLQNLICNGIKFQQADVPPRICVTCITEKGGDTPAMIRLSVEDNGIGFDEKYLDRIFTVFQRLHSRTEYAGTGVGLAICRKIAQRHGGDITAHSAPGRGATFVVTIPMHHINTPVPPMDEEEKIAVRNQSSTT